jgi:hypothetical protein
MSDEHVHGSADTAHDQHAVEKLGYEARDLVGQRRSVFIFAAFHFGGLLITGLIVYGIYLLIANFAPDFKGDIAAGKAVQSEAAKLQAEPGPDMETYLHKSDERLHGYGWANEEHTRANIPIEKAIEMTAGKNLPHRPGASE